MADWETLSKYPRLNPRDEEREWLDAPPDEIARIQSDLYGLHVSSPPVPWSGSGSARPLPAPPPDDPDPAARAAALQALRAEVEALPAKETAALAEAARKCPNLVGEEQRMAFLWREEYDAKLAAHRMASYWQYRCRLFGPEKAYLPLTLCGALRDDMVMLSQGLLNLLFERDRHGRPILFFDAVKYDRSKDSRASALRVYWYLLHVASEDPSARDRGVVVISYNKSMSLRNVDPEMTRSFSELEMCHLPVKVRSFHLCHPPLMFHILHPIMKLTLTARLRKRLKVHAGTEEDVLDSLAGYGLTRDCVPSVMGGNLRLDPVRWLSDRMLREGLCGWAGAAAAVPVPPPGLVVPQVAGAVGVTAAGATVEDIQSDARPKEVEEAMAARRTENRRERQDTQLNEGATHRVSCLDFQVGADEQNPNGFSSQDVHTFRGALNSATMRIVQPLQVPPLSVVPPTNVALPDGREAPKCSHRKRASTGSSARERGDPRMKLAVEVRLANPLMSLFDALLAGGFAFPTMAPGGRKELSDKKTKDADGVSLYQRKNQLNRRLREARRGDQRMDRAVATKVESPRMKLEDALMRGGFDFPMLGQMGDLCDRVVRDSDNVSLYSRKTELCNRLAALPEDQLRHITACSNEEDRIYMNPSKVAPIPSCRENVSEAITHAPSSTRAGVGEQCQIQDCSRRTCDLGGLQASPEDNDRGSTVLATTASPHALNEDGAGMKRSNSFIDSILELPGISELASSNHGSVTSGTHNHVDELIMGTWLWSQDDSALPRTDGVQSDANVVLC